LELVEVSEGVLVGVNTILPNKLVAAAVRTGLVPNLGEGWTIRPEARFGEENSRVDLLLERPVHPRDGESTPEFDDPIERLWIEVKNVTLVRNEVAAFPDAPTSRGRKHLRELARQVQAGDRAMLVFVVQRNDATSVTSADDIDPEYGEELRAAARAGVELIALGASVTPEQVVLDRVLPVTCILAP